MPLTRVLRKMRYEYSGEKDARWLIEWLENNSRTLKGKQVSRLLKDIFAFHRLIPRGLFHVPLAGQPPLSEAFEGIGEFRECSPHEYGALVRSIDRGLIRLPITLTLEGFSFRRGGEKRPALEVGPFNFGFKSEASQAVWVIARLGKDGLLDRVRQCRVCRRWLFARFLHQRACSSLCSRDAYRKSPKWRKQRAEYMRKYRREHRLRVGGRLRVLD